MSASPLCYRFLVGSSNVRKMMVGSIGVRETHGDLFTIENQTKGYVAENFAEEQFSDSIVISKPFIVSEDFPFICATPDYVLADHKWRLQVLEVKSGETDQKAKNNAFCVRSRTQVRVAMDVLGLKKGMIYAVRRFDPFAKCKCVGVEHLINENFLFENRDSIIRGYVRYLQNYFLQIYSLELSDGQSKQLLEYIDSRVPRSADPNRKLPSISSLKKKSKQWRKKRDGLGCHKAEGSFLPHGF